MFYIFHFVPQIIPSHLITKKNSDLDLKQPNHPKYCELLDNNHMISSNTLKPVVCPSVRPSFRPSVRPSVRPSIRPSVLPSIHGSAKITSGPEGSFSPQPELKRSPP